MANEQKYGDGTDSSVGTQFNTFLYQRKAIRDLEKSMFFSPLADVTTMPKHMGKKIKRYHYLPILDDRNINDQGLDATGATPTDAYTISKAGVALGQIEASTVIDDTAKALAEWNEIYVDMQGDAAVAAPGSGNLYGSSKDIGTISAKMPLLSEHGGRVNRVGNTRIDLEGSMEKFGIFDEWTQESLDFDTDAELEMHINREMLRAANEITEDALQVDLLNGAGVTRYGGDATATNEITGEGTASKITYEDLMRLDIDLDNNRCPKYTKIISGSRMIDTKTISAARVLYIGSELTPTMKKMTDLFGNAAFIPVQQYADAGNIMTGEIGSIDQFRVVVVPEMQHWSGAGAAVGTNPGYRETGGKYDVFPMLVVGSGAFTTIGFQTDGKSMKFNITTKKPGKAVADRFDPYGEKGFMSIKWYYGFMLLRPEYIAVCKVVAEL